MRFFASSLSVSLNEHHVRHQRRRLQGKALWHFVPSLQSQNLLFIYLFFPSQTSEILAALAAVFKGYSDEEKAAELKKVLLAHSAFFTAYCHPLPETFLALIRHQKCAEQRRLRIQSQECRREGDVLDY
jgi:hypothetical protein